MRNLFKKFKKKTGDSFCEGFDNYYEYAKKLGLDVNDYIENELHWPFALPILEKVVFPFLKENSTVCEIGPGTGRHARHIASYINEGSLHLFDHSSWLQQFLKNYFKDKNNVFVHDSNGQKIDMEDNSVDLIFSNGTFIELKLGAIFLMAKEFARISKPGGIVVFDYIDISRPEVWEELESLSKLPNCYTYHCHKTIDKLFLNENFIKIKEYTKSKSTYVTYQKK